MYSCFRKTCIFVVASLFIFLIGTVFSAYGATLHVSPDGKNSNAGTADAPMKNIDKAIAKAKAGDTILVAEGTYSGTFNIGYLTIDKALTLQGGYSSDFSSRDVMAHPTIFQPDNKSGSKSRKALLTWP